MLLSSSFRGLASRNSNRKWCKHGIKEVKKLICDSKEAESAFICVANSEQPWQTFCIPHLKLLEMFWTGAKISAWSNKNPASHSAQSKHLFYLKCQRKHIGPKVLLTHAVNTGYINITAAYCPSSRQHWVGHIQLRAQPWRRPGLPEGRQAQDHQQVSGWMWLLSLQPMLAVVPN